MLSSEMLVLSLVVVFAGLPLTIVLLMRKTEVQSKSDNVEIHLGIDPKRATGQPERTAGAQTLPSSVNGRA